MKLSKQERIGALVILVIVILAVGVFIFIKPRFEEIGISRTSLENKQQELTAAQEKAATKDPLKQQVIDAFEEGENLADMFFEEMTAYQAEAEFREFLAQCGCNVVVNSVSVSAPAVSTLGVSFVDEQEIVYNLKTYATQGVDPTEEELAAEARQQILRETLAGNQEVGSITISFDVVAIDQDELIKFCDAVNNYQKQEAGGLTRKACILNGASFSYPKVSDEYSKLAEEIANSAKEAGTKELYKKFNRTPPASETPAAAEGNEQTQLAVSDNIFTLSTSITFYSVARMQDPTDQLDQQDGIGF